MKQVVFYIAIGFLAAGLWGLVSGRIFFGSQMVYRRDGRANVYAGIIGYFLLASVSWFFSRPL
jgi:Leu/Phe-tRNA-protein transferase